MIFPFKTKTSKKLIIQPTPMIIDGVRFSSKSEGRRYLVLRNLQDKGLISNLEIQPKFKLYDGFELKDKEALSSLFSTTNSKRNWITEVTIKFDFSYLEPGNNRVVIEDAKLKNWQKGKKHAIKPDWILKVRLWLPLYQEEYELRIT